MANDLQQFIGIVFLPLSELAAGGVLASLLLVTFVGLMARVGKAIVNRERG